MGSVNKVILVGNLGRDAELRYTPGGAAVATLNLATTEVWNDKGGQRQERTTWHRVVVWGKTAESLTDYLTKGKQIYVEGRLQSRQWFVCKKCGANISDPKEEGRSGGRQPEIVCPKCQSVDYYPRTATEVRSDRVVLLSGAGGRGEPAGERGESAPQHAEGTREQTDVTDDDIPF